MSYSEDPSVEQLYQKILKRKPMPLPGLEEDVKTKALFRAIGIREYLLDRADRLEEPCMLCLEKPARRSQSRYVYETPWEKEATEKLFCCEECADTYLYDGDFSYFWCEPCGREICEQHPQNGWHIQFRYYDEQQVCLRCYQGLILENGIEREKLEEGKIPGMFFRYGNPEAKEAGYREVSGFSNFYINSQEKIDRFRNKALELMDEGKKVVIGYERLAYGGSEGYVTLMVKNQSES